MVQVLLKSNTLPPCTKTSQTCQMLTKTKTRKIKNVTFTIQIKFASSVFMKSQLSPEAPVYIPPPLRNVTNLGSNVTHLTPKSSPSSKSSPTNKEPQCSRYSRRSVRSSSSAPNSPRPILGNKLPFPRPILGRKSDENDRDEVDEFIGKEFRSMTRNFSRMKVTEDGGVSIKSDDTVC